MPQGMATFSPKKDLIPGQQAGHKINFPIFPRHNQPLSIDYWGKEEPVKGKIPLLGRCAVGAKMMTRKGNLTW